MLERVRKAEAKVGRPLGGVKILAVSKGQSLQRIQEYLDLSDAPKCLGENYLSELEEKSEALRGQEIEWHFIGSLQSRKIAAIAQQVRAIQSVSRAKELGIISKLKFKPDVFIQVNVSGERQKNGVSPENLEELFVVAENLGIRSALKGLMCVPENILGVDVKKIIKQFTLLRNLRDQHIAGGLLSMGMSADYEWAIHEGSDLVRIGSAIFGERP